jgi:hypothetical protein
VDVQAKPFPSSWAAWHDAVAEDAPRTLLCGGVEHSDVHYVRGVYPPQDECIFHLLQAVALEGPHKNAGCIHQLGALKARLWGMAHDRV